VPQENPRDPSTWVRRADDPRIVEVQRDLQTMKKAYPMATVIGTLVMGVFSAGMAFEFFKAQQITRSQFEAEQQERRQSESAAAQRLSKLEGKIDTLILMQTAKGKK
jgi:CHASE1-domain containing sensor protein